MRMYMLHDDILISHEPIGYSTKLASTELNGVIKYSDSTLHKL